MTSEDQLETVCVVVVGVMYRSVVWRSMQVDYVEQHKVGMQNNISCLFLHNVHQHPRQQYGMIWYASQTVLRLLPGYIRETDRASFRPPPSFLQFDLTV